MAVGDLDRDGHPDLIWQQDLTNVPSVWYMGGADGSTLLSYKYLAGGYPQPHTRIVAIGYLDGDGYPDLIWQWDESGGNGLAVWYMGGADGSTFLGSNYNFSGPQRGWRVAGPK